MPAYLEWRRLIEHEGGSLRSGLHHRRIASALSLVLEQSHLSWMNF